MKTNSRIVLISGRQGSGKTTTQKLLVDEWNKLPDHKATAINFADPLYEMHDVVRQVAARYGIAPKMPKDGPLLQVLGTDWARNTVDQNMWVNCLRGRISILEVQRGHFAYKHSLFVVGDCRFQNEFEAFPEALKVRLQATPEVRKFRCSMWRENQIHPSETDLDRHDENGLFDLTFDTGHVSDTAIVHAILLALEENAWMKVREQKNQIGTPA